jgi:hypothetical protein
MILTKTDRPLHWKVERGLSGGYKTRSVATVTETILSKAGRITLLLRLLCKGNRQKARMIFAEIISRARKVSFIDIDEPFDGLDFEARDYLVKRWMDNPDRDRHLLVSMHPSEIPMAPAQILPISMGKIWTVPPATSWPEIRKLLQQPKLVPA